MMFPTMDRLWDLASGLSFDVQTFFSSANISVPPPFANMTASRNFAPAIDTMHYLRSLVVSLLGYVLLGLGNDVAQSQGINTSSSIYNTRFPQVTWDNDLWQVRTQRLDRGHYQSRMSVCNGYLGINVAALGPFFEADTTVNGDNINGWVRGSKGDSSTRT